MDRLQLKIIRAQMNYSLTDFAGFLSIPKSTLQRYEDGSAKVPADMPSMIEAAKKRDKEAMRQLNRFIHERIARDFPMGIKSEEE